MSARAVRILAVILMAGIGGEAQENTAPAFVYPCARLKSPVQVDGELNAEEWAGTVDASGVTISNGSQLIREQMTFRVASDGDTLFVGARCLEPSMKTLVAQVRGWDGPVWRDDAVELFVDVGHTHKNYFQFIINPLGTGYDGKNLDPLWSGKWRCAAKCGPDRWTIEAAIPFPSMDLPTPAQSTLWGFNACRERRASGDVQLLNWADVQGNFHRPHLYGHILFLDGPWETAKPDTQAIAASLGAYRLFTPGGYWDIDPKGTIKEITYRSIVEEKIKTVPTMASLQKDIGDEGSELILMRFQPIEDEVSRIRKLLGTQKSVQAEDWAVSLATLDQVTGQFGDIYWRIKLDLLLKEM